MILVTGATGNVGSELTRALAARGESVRVLARQPDQASFPAGVQVAMGDLEDPGSLAPALHAVGKVFLLGGRLRPAAHPRCGCRARRVAHLPVRDRRKPAERGHADVAGRRSRRP
jgi:uncharacterized protein YbjT (DUF2867 family)